MVSDVHPLAHLAEPPSFEPEPSLLPVGGMDIIRSYADRIDDFFVVPDISDRVVRRVLKRIELAEWEELIAVVDQTVFGDGRAFAALTTGGLHWKELLWSGPRFQPWDRILQHRADPRLRDGFRIRIGEYVYWPTGTEADMTLFAAMIDELGGWSPANYDNERYDVAVSDGTTSESLTTVVAASSLDELIESVYFFTYGWNGVYVAPTIERSIAEPLRALLKIPAEHTLLAVPEFITTGSFVVTDRGLVGVRPDGDKVVKRSWEQVRARLHSLKIDDDKLEIDRRSFDLTSLELEDHQLLELIRFVAKRVPHESLS